MPPSTWPSGSRATSAQAAVWFWSTRIRERRQLWLENWSELAHRGKWPYDQEALENWAAPRLAADVEMDVRVVDGPPETALVELAKSTHSDWIVVGVQGRTALADLLIGRTTDRVLKLADRPVLAVPSTTASPGEVTS